NGEISAGREVDRAAALARRRIDRFVDCVSVERHAITLRAERAYVVGGRVGVRGRCQTRLSNAVEVGRGKYDGRCKTCNRDYFHLNVQRTRRVAAFDFSSAFPRRDLFVESNTVALATTDFEHIQTSLSRR